MYKKLKILFGLCLLASLPLLYQNCGEGNFAANISSEGDNSKQEIIIDVGDEDDDDKNKTFKKHIEYKALTADRMLIYNTMISVFGPTMQSFMVASVAWQSSDFGSPWDPYAKINHADCTKIRDPYYACTRGIILDLDAPPIAGVTAPREGRRITACEAATQNNGALQYAMKKIDPAATLAKPPELSDKNLSRVFELFFRGKPLPSANLTDALKIAHQAETDAKEGWRSVIKSVCLSPHWQVM
ncbi:MAG: hypothetical protein KDD33_07650 [Bdellovibrionales bacterium]|nr:hypothetical protein [Bdellovibrionales bacterium]